MHNTNQPTPIPDLQSLCLLPRLSKLRIPARFVDDLCISGLAQLRDLALYGRVDTPDRIMEEIHLILPTLQQLHIEDAELGSAILLEGSELWAHSPLEKLCLKADHNAPEIYTVLSQLSVLKCLALMNAGPSHLSALAALTRLEALSLAGFVHSRTRPLNLSSLHPTSMTALR